jgi:hypothetical protein
MNKSNAKLVLISLFMLIAMISLSKTASSKFFSIIKNKFIKKYKFLSKLNQMNLKRTDN